MLAIYNFKGLYIIIFCSEISIKMRSGSKLSNIYDETGTMQYLQNGSCKS